MSKDEERFQSNEFIGNDRRAWEQYYEQFGPEAYKYRRLYEEVVRQMQNLYRYAEQHEINLPNPGDSGSL